MKVIKKLNMEKETKAGANGQKMAKRFIVAIISIATLFFTNVVQAQTEVTHEHIAVHEHQELSRQEKEIRLKHLKSFSQKGTKVFVQVNYWDDNKFKQILLSEMGAKKIWRLVSTPQESDFILIVQAITRPHVQYTVSDMYFMVFDKDENLLWKSGVYLGHMSWKFLPSNFTIMKDVIRKYVKQALIVDIKSSKSVYEEPLDIIGHHKVSEAKFEASEDCFWEAIDFFAQYDYKSATDMFSKAISINPFNALSYKYRALAYYNLSKFGNAKNDIKQAMSLDPLNQQNDTIYHAIMIEKNEKYMRVWGPGGTMDRINNSLMTFSNALHSAATLNNNSNTAQVSRATTASSVSTAGLRKVSCSFCNGTGMNPTRERPAFYSYSSENYSSGMCNICGSNSNHYHKPCPSCNGKGYREVIAPNK
jgi:tetratricopeptide (TPR) repeat protein